MTDTGVEERIREALEAGQVDAATTLSIEAYGPEIYGFLVARLRSEGDAAEAFSDFTLDFWKGLPKFEWRCPVRVWAYTLARHAANRYASAPHRRPARNVPLSRAGNLSKVQAEVRSRTATHLRTETKSKVAELRERLPLEDQTVLTLRIDKNLAWTDIARVMIYDGDEPTMEALEKEAARLRKRFQLAKSRLREMAVAERLIE